MGRNPQKCMFHLGRQTVSLLLVLVLRVGFADGQSGNRPAKARQVTIDMGLYAEVFATCSPDGRWLAFEYNDTHDPDYPRIGILERGERPRTWRPLLQVNKNRHVYIGDASWSPDSAWLAVITNYPNGSAGLFSDTDTQIVKVNIHTAQVVRLTNFPPNTSLGPTTAWLRSGSILFSRPDDGIYVVPENGGEARKVLNLPTNKCPGIVNTLAVSPDEQRVSFVMDGDRDGRSEECNALWIAQLSTGTMQRLPTTGLHPVQPFWLERDLILFSGINGTGKSVPAGIFSISLESGEITAIHKGLYISPMVCDSGKTLYYSWGRALRTKTPAGKYWPVLNDNYGFHIWKEPLPGVRPKKKN